MRHDNLEVASRHLSAAQSAMKSELDANYDDGADLLWDAYSLTADAISQLEGHAARMAGPIRGPYLGGASP